MEDDRYAAAIGRAKSRGVRVRVLMDPRANPTYPANGPILNKIQGFGVPMRKRLTNYILHWKMMLFRDQGVVEFSGANFSPDAFNYGSTPPYVDYTDEAIYFSVRSGDRQQLQGKVRRFLGRHRQLGQLREHHRPTDARRAGRDLSDRPAAQLPARTELSIPRGLALQRGEESDERPRCGRHHVSHHRPRPQRCDDQFAGDETAFRCG